MQLISVNCGLPKEVMWKGKPVMTGIYKNPVEGRVKVGKLNLEGDGQADLTVHGGPNKAVYCYPSEHYEYWKGELSGMDLHWGAFGENLTTQGLSEAELKVGDRLEIGTSLLMVTQPRMPCFKLGIRFGRDDMVKRFLNSDRPGFYLSVLREGELSSGIPIRLLETEGKSISVVDLSRLYSSDRDNLPLLRQAVGVLALPEEWRLHFSNRIRKLEGLKPR